MIIKNAKTFTPDYGFVKSDIIIDGELISQSTNDISELICDELYAIPGLIDLHFHGAMGADFCDASEESLKIISEYEAKNGITSICPATLTLPTEELAEICKKGAEFLPLDGQSNIVGMHLEGPFISPDKIGAQNPKYIKIPDVESFDYIYKASDGMVKIISLAPETYGAFDFISAVKDRVSCSIGHTTANYVTATEAIEVGANHVTHLYNAMPPFNHREPGVVGAAFDAPNCNVELITDGVHVHPAVVRATFKMFGDDRIILISDSMMATGLEDGAYSLGGLPVTVKDHKATLANGTIAGSTTNLMGCVKFAVNNMNIPLVSAVKCATTNPAKALGIYDKYGSLDTGKYANIVLLDNNLEIKYVILRGKIIYQN